MLYLNPVLFATHSVGRMNPGPTLRSPPTNLTCGLHPAAYILQLPANIACMLFHAGQWSLLGSAAVMQGQLRVRSTPGLCSHEAEHSQADLGQNPENVCEPADSCIRFSGRVRVATMFQGRFCFRSLLPSDW